MCLPRDTTKTTENKEFPSAVFNGKDWETSFLPKGLDFVAQDR